MDRRVQFCEKFGGAKRQKVKVDEPLVSSLEDEATEVEHLLAEPKTENLLVDSVLSFAGMEFINPTGHDDFELGVLDGLLDGVEEVDDIHAANDISGACGDLLLDFELAEKSVNLYFVQSERPPLDNSSSESQSPGVSGSGDGALGLSESLTATILASDCKNLSLEKTVKSDLCVSFGSSECQELTENDLLFSHDLEDLEEVHDDDVKPSENRVTCDENERIDVHSVKGKRTRRPTKRYIEELSATKTKHEKGTEKTYAGVLENGAGDSLSDRTVLSSSKKDSCYGGISLSTEESEVYLDEKLRDIVSSRKFSSTASKYKRLEIKYEDGLHHATKIKVESREESCVGNGVQELPRRRRGRPKKSAIQILKSDDEWTRSDSEDDRVKRRKCKRRKSTNYNDRRKHQRMWTLSEVMKLVDGIAEYGTGRWTDIKNHLFPSSAYRTPVDLRDKWRNLLRASSACRPTNEQEEEVKQGVRHGIPYSVLHRVGELATIHPYPRFSPGGRYIRRKN